MSDRILYLRARYGAALLDAFLTGSGGEDDCNGLSLNPDPEVAAAELIDHYRKVDPTSNAAYTSWIVQQAIAGNLPVSRLSSATTALTAFERSKRHLPVEQRDIGRYASLDALLEVVASIDEHGCAA